MRALRISATVAMAVTLLFLFGGAVLGAYLSFYTGKQSELPKWNGWNYLWFSIREFAMISAVISIPFACIVFLAGFAAMIYASSTRHSAFQDSEQPSR